MINNSSTSTTTNSMMSSSSANNNNPQSPAGGLKTYFKTPEGRYKLQYEKTHPAGLLHYAHGKTLTQVPLSSFIFSRVLSPILEKISFFVIKIVI